MDISNRNPIKAARVKKRLTQQQLGDAVGVTKATISRIEAGHNFPSPAIANRIAKALGIRIDRIYAEAA